MEATDQTNLAVLGAKLEMVALQVQALSAEVRAGFASLRADTQQELHEQDERMRDAEVEIARLGEQIRTGDRLTSGLAVIASAVAAVIGSAK